MNKYYTSVIWVFFWRFYCLKYYCPLESSWLLIPLCCNTRECRVRGSLHKYWCKPYLYQNFSLYFLADIFHFSFLRFFQGFKKRIRLLGTFLDFSLAFLKIFFNWRVLIFFSGKQIHFQISWEKNDFKKKTKISFFRIIQGLKKKWLLGTF